MSSSSWIPLPQHAADPDPLASALQAIKRLESVPALLRMLCDNTGMGFAVIAYVTDKAWLACAVEDRIGFGLKTGGTLPVDSTLCKEARVNLLPIVIEDVRSDAVYADHHTPKLYDLQSYISVPILTPGGSYFGNLCAVDREPRKLREARTPNMFSTLADLIGRLLDSQAQVVELASDFDGEQKRGDLLEQFIAVMGHDLRNPLQAIGASARLLERRTSDPEVVRITSRMQGSIKRMTSLIEDVLELARSRLGAGMSVERRETHGLAAALQDVVEELRSSNPLIQIDESIQIDVPLVIDTERMQQLASNLLSNAITHGDCTRPIGFNAVVTDGMLKISVFNFGKPIEAADVAHLFEPYWRATGASASGGLGLGLYICSQIVNAHGGGIFVTSNSEDGTHFTAHVPCRVAAQSSSAVQQL